MRDFKLRKRFNKLVKDGGAGGGGRAIDLNSIPEKTAEQDGAYYYSRITTFKIAVDGDTETVSAPTYWVPYVPRIGDKVVRQDGATMSEWLVTGVATTEIVETAGSNPERGETKAAVDSWWLVKGAVYHVWTPEGVIRFVSSDAVLEYRGSSSPKSTSEK